jgi:predicted Zn-dependent protease
VDALRAMVAEADTSGFAALPRARQAGVLYSATFAASRVREPETASRLLARLETSAGNDAVAQRLVRLLDAEMALAKGDTARVLRLLDGDNQRRPELLLVSQAQVQGGRAADAAQHLQAWVATHPRDATAWQLLSSAYVATGQPLRGVRAEAEARVAQLDYPAALDRFKAAQDMVRKGAADHIEASIIDTRARAVESLVREQALER